MIGVKRLNIGKWLSPIVLSYLVGILLANVHILPIQQSISTTASEACILLAIPLLLYSTDIIGWFRYAKSSILSFFICLGSGVISSILMAYLFQGQLTDTWRLSGMLVGVYTGGTPNMQAIGLALEAEEATYILLNAADIFCSGVYLVLLTSILPVFLGSFLPKFQAPIDEHPEELIVEEKEAWVIGDILKAIGLTIVIIGLSVGLTWLIYGNLEKVALLILLLTTFSILASLSPRIRNWSGSFETGEYFLLMFCVAIGMLTDFSSLLAEGSTILLYTACVLSTSIILHYLFSALFRIDRDTAMITSTAAVFGPVFIGQIASVLNNRTLIVSGIATGLVGMALGNYLGLAVAYLLRSFL